VEDEDRRVLSPYVDPDVELMRALLRAMVAAERARAEAEPLEDGGDEDGCTTEVFDTRGA